ncbi:MAG: histidine kinase [Bacteroidota bacterium]
MRISGKYLLEQKWLQEVIIFITLFILFTLNDWTLIDSWKGLVLGICNFSVLFVHAQVHRFFVLPLLLDKQKPLPYALFGVILLLVFTTILFFTKKYLLYPDCYLLIKGKPETFLFDMATCAISVVAIVTPLVILRFYREQKRQSSLLLCSNEIELKLLRTQLNPHFMFNTFNNLYGISLQEPTRLPNLILQLSQLMRYQIENSCKEWVPLEEELVFIESYISLEEERVGERCKMHYEYNNETPEITYQIAPMVLITFVENAFKHGCNNIGECFVNIKVNLKNGILHLETRNSVSTNSQNSTVSMGIGLSNTEQRLRILYPGKYKLNIKPNKSDYRVDLTIDLNQSTNAR